MAGIIRGGLFGSQPQWQAERANAGPYGFTGGDIGV